MCGEVLAHKVLAIPSIAPERNAHVMAWLFETHRREYENFSQLPGESVETMYKCFSAIVNSIKANITNLSYSDHDRAMKLLHALDRSVCHSLI